LLHINGLQDDLLPPKHHPGASLRPLTHPDGGATPEHGTIEYAEKVADLADRTRDDAIPLLLDKVVREQSMFEHSDVGGWSAADHQSKKREAAALPIKWDKTYEVTNLPLDEWG